MRYQRIQKQKQKYHHQNLKSGSLKAQINHKPQTEAQEADGIKKRGESNIDKKIIVFPHAVSSNG